MPTTPLEFVAILLPFFNDVIFIEGLCFQREGILFREFDQIFSDVFGKRAEAHKAIVESLAHGSRTVSEISDALGKERSGHLSKHLQDLVLGGFLARDAVFDPKTGRATRTEKYRLRDNYARFYLRYVTRLSLYRTCIPPH